MKRERLVALSLVIGGLFLIGGSIVLMIGWLVSFEAAREYATDMVRVMSTGTTVPIFQTEPPGGESLFGALAPVLIAIAGTAALVLGIQSLSKAP